MRSSLRVGCLGAAAGVLIFSLVAAAAALPVWRWWIHRPPVVEQGTTLVLELSGDLPEREPPDLRPFESGARWSVFRVWDCLRKAAVDRRIAAILIKPGGLATGWAKLAEVRVALQAFARTRKPVVAYLHTPSSRDYYIASAASRVVSAPGDYLNVKGLRAELLYARGALDKLGIVPEFEAVGQYKDGPDTLTRRDMSASTAEVMKSILDQRLQDLTQAIAQGRRKSPDEVRVLLDRGPFLAKTALATGLVDAIAFEPAVEAELAGRLGQEKLIKLDAATYQRVPADSLGLEGGSSRIAMLVASGEIAQSASYDPLAEILRPEELIREVEALRDDKAVRGVILRIDSPGGDAVASEQMLQAVRELSAKKPVVVSMSDLAASGGYELAIGVPWLLAYPQSLTGSIGIFYGKLDLRGLYGKLGIHYQVLTRGKNAALDSSVTGLDFEGRQKVREMLETMYRDFIADVARGRNRTPEQIEAVAQGRVWTGTDARQAALIDELGGIDAAIAALRRRAGIPDGEKIRLDVYPKAPGPLAWWQARLDSLPQVTASPKAGFQRRLPMDIAIH